MTSTQASPATMTEPPAAPFAGFGVWVQADEHCPAGWMSHAHEGIEGFGGPIAFLSAEDAGLAAEGAVGSRVVRLLVSIIPD